MYRFYADKGQISESAVRLTGTDVNHIGNVLRMGKGDELIICDGQGMDYHCIIEDVTAGEVALSVKEKRETDAELPCKVTLFQAVPKRDKMEFLIQKAVELGVHAIVPVFTKRCVVRWDDAKGKRKTERWQAIAEAAAKQSARGVVPRVEEPVRLEEALGRVKEFDMGLIPYEMAGDAGVGMEDSRNVFERACRTRSVCVFIGPEGGFEEGEVEGALAHGLTMVSLGKRILRTETAGMVVLAYMMMRMDG